MGTMQNLRMRIMAPTDVPAVTALNNAATPAMSPLTEDEMAALLERCNVALVASNRERRIIAFVLSMGMGQDYESENYRYFENQGLRHQYVDRVVVDPSAKGTGIGRALYESVFEHARQTGANEVTSEVRLGDEYDGSMAFHERLGFRRVAEQDTHGGSLRVALLARSVY